MKSKEETVEKDPKINDAEITEDGHLLVTFNQACGFPSTRRILLEAEALFAIGEEYGNLMPEGYNDFPGVPVVSHDSVFEDDGDDNEPEETREAPEGRAAPSSGRDNERTDWHEDA